LAVAEEVEVLPRGEQQGQHEKACDAHRLGEFALTGFVNFADDRIVPNVFLYCVLECLHGVLRWCTYVRSAARSLALRARGLRVISSSLGTIGFLVSTRTPASPDSSARR